MTGSLSSSLLPSPLANDRNSLPDKKMSTTKRIVVVEDEADLAELLAYNLRRAGYETEVCRDGASGSRRIMETIPDLAILDVMLPHVSGLQIARQMRTSPKTARVPILMLTAKAEEADQIAGLQVGADDYVTKPFSMKVLLARVEAMLRRSRTAGPESADVIEISGVRVDLSTHEASVRGESVKLTLTEFRLLVALMRGKGKVLSRADLMYTAMGPDVLVTTRTIDVHVAAIRKKLGPCGHMIRTIRGVGYLFDEHATPGQDAADGAE
jgi:two-component system phosphate regulon response regulator PhoB